MKLHEIISVNEKRGKEILLEAMHPYKKSLYTYYKREFCCEPVLMVTAVFNAVQYGKIVSSNEFLEAVEDYLDAAEITDSEEWEIEAELIWFRSVMLADF